MFVFHTKVLGEPFHGKLSALVVAFSCFRSVRGQISEFQTTARVVNLMCC